MAQMDRIESGATERFGHQAPAEEPRRLPLAMRRGAFGRCPCCGEGRLFGAYLKVADHCEACGTDFSHHRADDLPAYVVMIVVGHIVVGGMLSAETHSSWPLWVHVVLWPLLAIVLALTILQPVKGAIVGLQWALRMHGFASRPDGDEDPALRPRPEPVTHP